MKKYEIIIDVCKTGSFTKTAHRLNYSQAAVSQTVKSFEAELGFPIFKRKKSGVELLPAAREVIDSLEVITAEQKHLKEISDSLTKSDSGLIRIGTIFSMAVNLLPNILKEFHVIYPDINFDIFCGEYDEIHTKLSNGEIDLAFTSKYGAEGFTQIELLQDEFMAVMPVDHPLSKKMALSIHDLEGVPYIPSGEKFDFEIGEIFDFEIGEIFDTVRITPTVSFKLTDELVSHKLIEAGFGVSVSTKYLLDATMAFADICIRPFKEHYYRTLVIAKNDLRFCPAAAITFLNFLKEQLEQNSLHLY